jgi:hypothetical protein
MHHRWMARTIKDSHECPFREQMKRFACISKHKCESNNNKTETRLNLSRKISIFVDRLNLRSESHDNSTFLVFHKGRCRGIWSMKDKYVRARSFCSDVFLQPNLASHRWVDSWSRGSHSTTALESLVGGILTNSNDSNPWPNTSFGGSPSAISQKGYLVNQKSTEESDNERLWFWIKKFILQGLSMKKPPIFTFLYKLGQSRVDRKQSLALTRLNILLLQKVRINHWIDAFRRLEWTLKNKSGNYRETESSLARHGSTRNPALPRELRIWQRRRSQVVYFCRVNISKSPIIESMGPIRMVVSWIASTIKT